MTETGKEIAVLAGALAFFVVVLTVILALVKIAVTLSTAITGG